ncbi:MAG TPA: lipoprotein signal peptidase [Bacteroidia bacterium]|nr:lipoprotein signal peptidase [Bacteroidia bacterium]HNU32464.1 lipoprotein signal peptidase [Bacteroidia bacterium]
MKRSLIIIVVVLLLDQILKFWIKTNMYIGEEFKITEWFIIHFTENNGMAFGMEFKGEFGKLFLSSFRIIVVAGIFWYLHHLVKTKAHTAFTTAMSFITAGALGNIIDSAFYGMLFSSSEYQVASFLSADGGYATFLHGKVVDMFYFPIIETHYPDWFPIWGGKEFIFFSPVFNVADFSISTGVAIIILFNKSIFKEEKKEEPTVTPEEDSANSNQPG